jgi:hypothetical protein
LFLFLFVVLVEVVVVFEAVAVLKKTEHHNQQRPYKRTTFVVPSGVNDFLTHTHTKRTRVMGFLLT